MLPERGPGQRGRKRHWCSDNCRKRAWDREVQPRAACRDCGAVLCPPSLRKGYERCRPCHFKRVGAEKEEILSFIEWMYNEGRPLREISEEIGWRNTGTYLDLLRKAGRIGYRYKACERRAA